MDRQQTIRKARKVLKENATELQTQIEHFLKDCFGKNEKEVLDIYKTYEGIWVRHCQYRNKIAALKEESGKKKYSPIVLLEDAFERSCINGHRKIKQAKAAIPEMEFVEMTRIFEIFRPKTKWERFVLFIRRKGFFVKGNNPKRGGLPKYENPPAIPDKPTKLSLVK